jgi:hypothetical protein
MILFMHEHGALLKEQPETHGDFDSREAIVAMSFRSSNSLIRLKMQCNVSNHSKLTPAPPSQPNLNRPLEAL